MADYTDARRAAAAANMAAVRTNPAFGDTPELREAYYKRVWRVLWTLLTAMMTACLWLSIYPRPLAPLLWLEAAAPLAVLGVVWSSKGMSSHVWRRPQGPASIAALFAFPAIGLAMMAQLEGHLTEMSQVLVVAAAVGVFLGVTIFLTSGARPHRTLMALASAMMLAMYAGGLFCLADTTLDRSPAQGFRTEVLERRHTFKSRTYQIRLGPWGQRGAQTLEVTGHLYYGVNVGDVVCLKLRRGLLNTPWFSVDVCPPGAKAS